MRSPKPTPASEPLLGGPPIPEMKIEPAEISLRASNVSGPPIPDLAEIIAAPEPPKIGQTKVVSVSVTDDVPLKDILIELSRLADVDVEIDSSITGGITFRAKDRPFNEVIDRICSMSGLRYSMRKNVLRIERDLPYIQTYPLDMLNIDRSAKGNIATGAIDGESGGNSSSSSSSRSSSNSNSGNNSSSGGGNSSSTITSESAGELWTKFQDSLSKIASFKPVNLGTNAAATAAANGGAFYSLNRQAGTLTFSGTEAQHAILRKFIKAVESNASSQVLIEAKIVEVKLNDHYQAGINWSNLGGRSVDFSQNLSDVTTEAAISPATINVLKNDILRTGVDLSAAVNLLDEFGTTRALSSPRLNAMNNQQAVLTFTENLVYFHVNIEVTPAVAATATSAATPALVEVATEQKTAPVGIQLVMQPTINKESNEITLSVRPTLSKVTKFVNDPGFEVGKAVAAGNLDSGSPILTTLDSVQSKIPQLEVRELDSILKVTSGEVMVIGGLLEDSFVTDDASLPGASELPVFGSLFKSVDRTNVKKELVIFIRATIVPSTGNASSSDKTLYNKFIDDPIPLDF